MHNRSMDKKMSVLVIDDEVSLEVVYRNFLAKLGAEVNFCDHPQKAWRAIDKDVYDLIITDLKMPVITGDEFVSIVRASKLNSHTPIIMCSAFINKLVITEMTRESKVYFLSKPFDSKALLDLVTKAVGEKPTLVSTEIERSLNQTWLQDFSKKLHELSKEKIDIHTVEKFDVWNFDSVCINTCFAQGGQLHTVTLLMKLKTFLKIAGLVQGTQYKDIEDEALHRWQDLLRDVMKGSGKATFAKVISQEILSVRGEQAVLCKLHSVSLEILIRLT